MLPALRLEADGLAAWDQVKSGGWEGLVAKDSASRYIGGSTRSWLKVKVRHEGRFVVIGIDVPLAGSFSLLLAARHGRRRVYGRPSRVGCSPSNRRRATRTMHTAVDTRMRRRGA